MPDASIQMQHKSFNGRIDGLGNRIEEIIRLEAFCQHHGYVCHYAWRNENDFRSYPILFTAKMVEPTENVDCLQEHPLIESISGEFDQTKILDAARQITPRFEIGFGEGSAPVGIHIRGTDRIGIDHPHFMKNEKEFKTFLLKTLHLVNQEKPKLVFVCADKKIYKDAFVSLLDDSIEIVEPECPEDVGGVYKDFFGLAKCNKIYMTSKFSSFAITASLIGNVPVVSLREDPEVADRYKALFEYQLNVDCELDFESLKFNESLLHWVKRIKLRCKAVARTLFRRRR